MIDGNVRRVARPVVISGVGVVSPLGVTPAGYRDALLAGSSGVAPITAFDASACRSRRAALVSGFDPTASIPPMKLRRMDDTSRYAMVITRQALEDAAYPLIADGDERVGVVLGTFTAGGQPTTEYLTALHAGGAAGAPALLFNSTVGNAPASLAGLEYKLRGPNITVGLKEASSLSAIVTAVDMLRMGRASALVSGGVDAIFEIFYRVHDRFNVFTQGNAPTPFGAAHDGFLLGEGGYALLLEDAESLAQRDGRRHAELLGVGATSAAVPINRWPDQPASLVRAMQAALADADVATGDIGVIYASANGAPVLDDLEARAIEEIFGSHRPVVTSIKGAIGESGASGAGACVAAVLCGALWEAPPIHGIDQIAPRAAGLNIAVTRPRLATPYALINSVSSGGSVFSIVMRVGDA
jgi:3-oxoacyl-[acyl-carrier-protein] synthase II